MPSALEHKGTNLERSVKSYPATRCQRPKDLKLLSTPNPFAWSKAIFETLTFTQLVMNFLYFTEAELL